MSNTDISKVLSGLTLEKAKPPLLVERFDLMEVWRPYLIARGLEEWITKDVIEEHFAAEAGGAKVESVEVRERGREAKVVFLNPQGQQQHMCASMQMIPNLLHFYSCFGIPVKHRISWPDC